MKNLKLKIVSIAGSAALILAAMTGPLMAWGLGVGLQGSLAYVSTDGTETLKSNSTKTSESRNAWAPLGLSLIHI